MAAQRIAGLDERGVRQVVALAVEGEQPGHLHLPLVHLPPLGAPRHVGGQPFEELVGAAQPAGQAVDPRPGAELGPAQPVERTETDLVTLVEEGALEALDCVHGPQPRPTTEHLHEFLFRVQDHGAYGGTAG